MPFCEVSWVDMVCCWRYAESGEPDEGEDFEKFSGILICQDGALGFPSSHFFSLLICALVWHKKVFGAIRNQSLLIISL